MAYPQWSFRVVADTAARFHLDPLRSLQIWSIIWLISGCYLIALRLTFLRDGLPPLTTIGITSLYLAICAYFGFGMRGHIEGNFFYPQLSATTLALAGVFVLQRFKLNYNIAALFVILWGGVVIPNFHLIPAAWFSFSGVIVLALIAANLRQRFIYPPIIGLVTGVLLDTPGRKQDGIFGQQQWMVSDPRRATLGSWDVGGSRSFCSNLAYVSYLISFEANKPGSRSI